MQRRVMSVIVAFALISTLWIPQPAVAVSGVIFSENFDSVIVPSLPAGWTTGDSPDCDDYTQWVTISSGELGTDGGSPGAAFVEAPYGREAICLESPTIMLHNSAEAAQLTFRHHYDTDFPYDGGVLDISIDGGAYQDIIDAGGTFVSGEYDYQRDETTPDDPLSGRMFWTGGWGGYITTTIDLPMYANGHTVQLRWMYGSDLSVAVVGWAVDSIVLTGETSGVSSTATGTTADSVPYRFGTWTTSDVTVSLTATDPTGPGVGDITYSASGATAIASTTESVPTAITIANEGVTTVSFFGTDLEGNDETSKAVDVLIDRSPPLLNLPAHITVAADGPSGSIVDYVATATDALSGVDEVSCTMPSGSLFSTGTTTVTCIATDLVGNVATGTFLIIVNATDVQIDQLRVLVENLEIRATSSVAASIRRTLTSLVNSIDSLESSGPTYLTCLQLESFDMYVQSQVSRRRIAANEAEPLFMKTTEIRASLGCWGADN